MIEFPTIVSTSLNEKRTTYNKQPYFTMKNVLVLALLAQTVFCFAQTDTLPVADDFRKNEWYFSYSPPPLSGAELGEISNWTGFGFSDNLDEDHNSIGLFNLGYHRFINRRMSYGIELTYGHITTTSSPGNDQLSRRWTHFVFPNFRLDFRYISKPKFQMYSGLALGLLLFETNRTRTYSNIGGSYTEEKNSHLFGGISLLHINAVGLRFGGKTAFFTEVGLGLNSLIRAGVTSRF